MKNDEVILTETLSQIEAFVFQNPLELLTQFRQIYIGTELYGPSIPDCVRPASEGESSLDEQSEQSDVYFPTVRQLLLFIINPRSAIVDSGRVVLAPKSLGIYLQKIDKITYRDCQYRSEPYLRVEGQSIDQMADLVEWARVSWDTKCSYIEEVKYSANQVVIRNLRFDTTFTQLRQGVMALCGLEVAQWTGLTPLQETYNTIVTVNYLSDAVKMCEQLDWKYVFNEFELVKANIIPF